MWYGSVHETGYTIVMKQPGPKLKWPVSGRLGASENRIAIHVHTHNNTSEIAHIKIPALKILKVNAAISSFSPRQMGRAAQGYQPGNQPHT